MLPLILHASCSQNQKLKKAEQRKVQQANKASNKAALVKAAEQQAIKDEAAAIVAAAFAQGAESEDAHPKPDPEPPLSIKEQAAAIAAAAFAQAPADAQQVRQVVPGQHMMTQPMSHHMLTWPLIHMLHNRSDACQMCQHVPTTDSMLNNHLGRHPGRLLVPSTNLLRMCKT